MRLVQSVLATSYLMFGLSFSVFAQKWDMALAYGASNFHSSNATEFAEKVSKKSTVIELYATERARNIFSAFHVTILRKSTFCVKCGWFG